VLVSANGYVNVNVSEAKHMIESNPELVILDVRTLEEYESGHVQNAVLIPVTELQDRIGELDKEKETLVYCRAGRRSVTASEMLVANGFVSVYNMLGGITAWRDAGYWIEIIHKGDLIINGTQMFVIENCTYIQTGNLYVEDWAKLIVRNSELQINQSYPLQYEFVFEDYGILELKDAVLGSERQISSRFHNHSKCNFGNVTLGGVWFWFSDYSEVSIYQLTFFGDSWLLFGGNCNVSIEDSRIWGIKILGETCKIRISGSYIGPPGGLRFEFSRGTIVNVIDLSLGFKEYLDLKEKILVHGALIDVALNKTFVNSWGIGVYYDSETIISGSVIGDLGIQIPGLSVHLDDLKPQFHEYKSVGQMTFNKTEIEHIDLSIYEGSDVTITNSTFSIVHTHDNSNVFLINSIMNELKAYHFFGSLCFERTTVERVAWMMYSDFYIYGNVSLEELGEVWWCSCNVTRDYGIAVKDRYNQLVSNTSLILLSEEDVIIWNGTTGTQGRTNFNLTFSDNNYTDTLRLMALKGDFSATMNVNFLSDTPVVLTMRYFADLNGDGKVNIVDIYIVARAFGSKLGESNWNPDADLDNNGEINIIDIYMVARKFGKTL
jgi:rhodanese-related sulfurtransferase